MARHKIITFINLSGLVLGISSFLLIMIWVGYEMSFDKFNENKDRIQRLCVDLEAGNHMIYPMSMPNAAELLIEDFPEIVDAARLEAPTRATIKVGDKSFIEPGFCHGDNSIFEVFSFPFIAGNPSTALVNPYSVVITQTIADKYFKHSDPLGEEIQIGGRGPYIITGIIKDIPQNSHFRFQVMASFSTLYEDNKEMMENWFHIQFFTYLLLDENANWKKLETKLPEFVERYLGETLSTYGAKLTMFLQPLTNIHLYSELKGDLAQQADMKYLYLFLGIALFVLLIACINFINLSTANSIVRAKEIGMRKTIGSN